MNIKKRVLMGARRATGTLFGCSANAEFNNNVNTDNEVVIIVDSANAELMILNFVAFSAFVVFATFLQLEMILEFVNKTADAVLLTNLSYR